MRLISFAVARPSLPCPPHIVKPGTTPVKPCGLNHLHLQLLPRYAGERIGSTRFVAERRPLVDGEDTVRRMRAVLQLPIQSGPLPEPPAPVAP
jgi:hypothetical protein